MMKLLCLTVLAAVFGQTPMNGVGDNAGFEKQTTKTCKLPIKLNDEKDIHPVTEIPIGLANSCRKCMYMKTDMSYIQSTLDEEMERELPSGSDAPYNINCMSEGGDVEEGQCASGQQCLSTSFYMGVDYYGMLQTGFRVYIKSCNDDEFLQNHSGCSDISQFQDEIIRDLGDLGGATVTSMCGVVCTCDGYNCNN